VVSNSVSVKVRWSEADAAGIVFYPRFFEWFDLGTEALFESLALPWPEMFPAERIVGVPIVETGARFASPVRYGDEVRIQTAVSAVHERTFRVDHEVSVGGRRCATGFEVRAWVARPESGGALAAKPIPPRIAARLRGEPEP
jgi:YbgC/YbaW family acyl-CoA thioester hydrolase